MNSGFPEILINGNVFIISIVIFIMSLYLLLFKKKKMNEKLRISVVLSLLITGVILALFLWLTFNAGNIPDYVQKEMLKLGDEEITISKVEVLEEKLYIEGELSNHQRYSDYSYIIKNGSMFITLYGHPWNKDNEETNFSLEIKDDLKGINKLYLRSGGMNVERIIYEKASQ